MFHVPVGFCTEQSNITCDNIIVLKASLSKTIYTGLIFQAPESEFDVFHSILHIIATEMQEKSTRSIRDSLLIVKYQ